MAALGLMLGGEEQVEVNQGFLGRDPPRIRVHGDELVDPLHRLHEVIGHGPVGNLRGQGDCVVDVVLAHDQLACHPQHVLQHLERASVVLEPLHQRLVTRQRLEVVAQCLPCCERAVFILKLQQLGLYCFIETPLQQRYSGSAGGGEWLYVFTLKDFRDCHDLSDSLGQFKHRVTDVLTSVSGFQPYNPRNCLRESIPQIIDELANAYACGVAQELRIHRIWQLHFLQVCLHLRLGHRVADELVDVFERFGILLSHGGRASDRHDVVDLRCALPLFRRQFGLVFLVLPQHPDGISMQDFMQDGFLSQSLAGKGKGIRTRVVLRCLAFFLQSVDDFRIPDNIGTFDYDVRAE